MITHAQDLKLARQVAAGDREAFERFFGETFPRLYRFVLQRMQQEEEGARDVCQQTMERAIRGMGGYRGEASLLTWICQIARSEMANHWERNARHAGAKFASYDQDRSLRGALESLAADPALTPDVLGERWERVRRVQAILDHLPANYGDALEWKYVEGLSAEQIGERLRLSAAAAHSLLARARRAFRAEYEAMGEEPA